MSDLDNAINSINASAAKAENTAGFLDDMSTFDDQSSVTNPNNGQTVASIPKQVKDRTDELFTAAESDINQAVSAAAQSATDAQDAADSIGRYQGLWPDTGGSANKGDTYQTQVSGTPTGQYFTALQNTTVDPVGDDVNWREVISERSLGNLTNYQAATVADMIAGNPVAIAVGSTCLVCGTLWLRVSDSQQDLTDFTPLNDVYMGGFGINFDGTDESQKVNDALSNGYVLHMTDEQVISYSQGMTIGLNGGGVVGGAFNCIADFSGTHMAVSADNATLTSKFIGNQNSGRGVVRLTAGIKGFKSKLIEFDGFYSSSSVYMVPMWIETDNTEFDIDKLKFNNIKNLGNGVIGDDDGSIRLVNMQGSVDTNEQMRIGTVEFDDVFCVNAQGNRIREDADAVVTAGFVRIPVTIDLIKGRNIGKRCLKTQAKGLHCKAIHYTHTVQDVEHDTIFDQQDSDNTVTTIRGFGNIFSFYRSLSRDGFQMDGGGVDSCLGETSYIDPTEIASARGTLDIQAGNGLSFPNWNVKGGKLGVRIDVRNNSNITDIEISGNIEAEYSHYVRNTNPSSVNAKVDNIRFGGVLNSTANDAAPGSDTIVQNGGAIGTIKYLTGATIKAGGSFDINARVRNIAALRIPAGMTFESSDMISLDMISVEKCTIVGISETDADTSRQVIRMTTCGGGTISDVGGSKVTGTSEGMVSVNGCDNLKFDNINNASTGQDITFKDSGGTSNSNCYVDGSTRKVTAVSTYNETNLEWDGAPSYGALAGAVNYVRRGYIFTDTTAYKTYVWSGFNYVATT